MELNKLLDEYKEITILMIRSIEDDKKIELLLEKRQEILNRISVECDGKSIIDRNEKKNQINQYEEQLYSLINKKMLEVKKNIKKIKQSQIVYNKYADFNGNAMIFSTKI